MTSEKHNDFNCAQRAHQNTLEGLPFFLVNLLLAGIRHPCGAATFGTIFLVGLIVYSIGYYSGDPEKRVPGALIGGLFGLFPLVGLSVSTAAGLLGWW